MPLTTSTKLPFSLPVKDGLLVITCEEGLEEAITVTVEGGLEGLALELGVGLVGVCCGLRGVR